jgi:glucosamine--fructose-6-phosphate aminotransferase (isomerizing)
MNPNGEIMRSEICEIPDVFTKISKSLPEIVRIAELIREEGFNSVQIIARGTSKNVGKFLANLIENYLGLPVSFPSLSSVSIYGSQLRYRNTLTIAISQSGESPDLIAFMKAVKEQSATSILITNRSTSPLASYVTYVVDVKAGEEFAVAATKSYSATLLACYMLVYSMQKKDVNLESLLQASQKQIVSYDEIGSLANKLNLEKAITLLGRGYFRGSSDEAALKIQETCTVNVQSHSAAEFVHGPISSLKNGDQVIILTSPHSPESALKDLLPRIRDKKPVIFWIGENALVRMGEIVIPYETVNSEELSAILVSIVFQQLACELSLKRGLNPDAPIGLEKVTRTV